MSLRVDCRTLGASIVYAVNSAILRLLAATLAIVPLALTMMHAIRHVVLGRIFMHADSRTTAAAPASAALA